MISVCWLLLSRIGTRRDAINRDRRDMIAIMIMMWPFVQNQYFASDQFILMNRSQLRCSLATTPSPPSSTSPSSRSTSHPLHFAIHIVAAQTRLVVSPIR